MATNVNQLLTYNLQCPICLNVFREPKLLTCSHTYCKGCIARLFKSQKKTEKISCPVCRKCTVVPRGNIDSLQTNIPVKSLADDVKNQSKLCSICKSDEKPLAFTYCSECDDYMCVECHKTHSNWDKFSGHDVVTVEDIVAGRVSVKKRRKCKKHASEEEECFCADCKKYVCFRCGMMEHTRAGHNILEGREHEETQKENIVELRRIADEKTAKVDEYIKYIEDQQENLKSVLERLTNEIGHACEKSMEQLKDRRNLLIKECGKRIGALGKELQGMKDNSRLQIAQIGDVSELVGNGVKIPLEGESLAAHESLCSDLKDIIRKTSPDYNLPQDASRRGEQVTFQRVRGQNKVQSALDLGEIVMARWVLKKKIVFTAKDSVNCVASMPDGRLAAGSRFGGLYIVTLSGSQETVLKGIGIRRIVFMSDGRCIVRDIHNTITVYSPSFTKLDFQFESVGHDEGGFGGLAIDQNEETIISSFTKIRKIFVSKITGGQAKKKISCKFEPLQVFAMPAGRFLVSTDEFTVSVVDAAGMISHHVSKSGIHAQPTLCLDGTVLIAWVNHAKGILTIDQYSRDLSLLRILVADFKIEVPQHPWYHLREFVSGELAFFTPDMVYVFHRIMPTV